MSIDWLTLVSSINWPEVVVSLALASIVTYFTQRWYRKRPRKSKFTIMVSTIAKSETDVTSKSMQFQVGAKGDLQNVSIQEIAGVVSQVLAGEPEDDGLKRELERLNNKLDQIDLRLAGIVRTGIQTTLAILGATIVLTGLGNLIQNGKVVLESWSSPSNFIIFVGFLVMTLAAFMFSPGFLRGVRIAFWVLVGIVSCWTIVLIVLLLLK